MRRTLPYRAAALSVAALLLHSIAPVVASDQPEADRNAIIKLGQITGEDSFAARVRSMLKKKLDVSKLVPSAVKMADAKDAQLSYYSAFTLALAAADAKDLTASEKLYRVCIAKASKLYDAEKLREAYSGLIEAYFENKKFADTIRVCREVLEKKPDEESPRILLVIDDKDETIDVSGYDPLKAFRPKVHQQLILALAKDGKIDQALKMAESLARQSEGWRERQFKARILQEAGKFSEAAKVYEDVLDRIAQDTDLPQKSKDALADNTRYILSNVYLEAKKIDKSLEILKDLVDRHPDDAGYNNDLGYIWADNGMHLDEAEKLIRKALELDRKQRKENPDTDEDKDRGAYLDSLGWVLFKKKNYEEAKKYLIEALKDTDAQHIEIFDHLGETYMALGQRDAALDAWRRGLSVAGSDRREQERKVEVEKKIEKYSK